MEWLGYGLAVIGVGLALIPLAFEKEIPEPLHMPLLYGGIGLLVLGIAVGLKRPWDIFRTWIKRRFGPMPVAFVYLAIKQSKAFKEGYEMDGFNTAVAMLVSQKRIKLLGFPGGPGKGNRLVRIPTSHFDGYRIFIAPPDIAYTVKKETDPFHIPNAPIEGRYFTLQVSRNFFNEFYKLLRQQEETRPRAGQTGQERLL